MIPNFILTIFYMRIGLLNTNLKIAVGKLFVIKLWLDDLYCIGYHQEGATALFTPTMGILINIICMLADGHARES